MKDVTGNFTFTVPETAPQVEERGKKIPKTFEFVECENEQEALEYLQSKEWNIVDLVNAKILGLSRSSAYQNATAVYKPSEVSAEDIQNRMIRDMIRLGISEDVAKKQVEQLLSASK
jgi:hypothetical protein